VMKNLIYNIGITLYSFAIRILFPFSSKPRKMTKGHWVVYDLLRQQINPNAQYIWFHAASLGEFEQGRPLIEKIRLLHPEYKILLTFFSPSGYEVRKHYRGADVVCYLPMDKPRNVRRFLALTNPKMVFFIKYEFWKNYLDELHKRRIPVYSVSSIFRRDQIFFKWYGGTLGVNNVSVVGDTRFDRVLEIKDQVKELPLVEKFKGNHFTLVCGSSWAPDEDIFIEYFNTHPEMKLIIAPHVIHESHLIEIINKLKRPYVFYKRATMDNVANADCLIINCFGLLSSIYRYGDVAYIGGGFGEGIHNTLEAAVYDIPVLFGPDHDRFKEASDLIEQGGAYCIHQAKEFDDLMDQFQSDSDFLKETGQKSGGYVKSQAGATDLILSKINL